MKTKYNVSRTFPLIIFSGGRSEEWVSCHSVALRSDEEKRLYRLHTFLASFPRDTWRESPPRLSSLTFWRVLEYLLCTKGDKWITHALTFLIPAFWNRISMILRKNNFFLSRYTFQISQFFYSLDFFFTTITVIILENFFLFFFFFISKARFSKKLGDGLDKGCFFFLSGRIECRQTFETYYSDGFNFASCDSYAKQDLNVSLFSGNILSRFSPRFELFISRNNRTRLYTSGTCTWNNEKIWNIIVTKKK